MSAEDKKKKLISLPWQALFNMALNMQLEEADVKGSDKEQIIGKLILNGITDEEIEKLVNDYIYGDRVTFTLWSFEHTLTEAELTNVRKLTGEEDYFLNINGFRKLQFVSVEEVSDRLQILYVYSKEHSYISEDGHDASIWELHRGCLWIGLTETYLACISKHEKMTRSIVGFIARHIGNPLKQMKFPKAAIDRCTNPEAISRVVLQSPNGEKTAISKAGGITEAQEAEIGRIREGRIDTSGSYIAKVSDETTATIKYNMSRGNIGILKHLSTPELFRWTGRAIQVVMEEIRNLKGKPAEYIFKEMGIELKWPSFDKSMYEGLNWILTQVINASSSFEDYSIIIDKCICAVLEDSRYFIKVPRVYCGSCESYEVPVCGNCGAVLKSDSQGNLSCKCGAPFSVTCAENHKGCVEIKYWYIPQERLMKALNKQMNTIYKDVNFNYNICIMDDLLTLSFINEEKQEETEIPFSEIIEFQKTSEVYSERIQEYALRLKEKCSKSCSDSNIAKCLCDKGMDCLPKIFYGILPGFRPQPHGVKEYGDFSSQVTVGRKHYEMKGIIKSNSENKGKKTLESMFYTHLKSTSKEGEEMIRQFIEQGMNDSRCELIAVVAPQYFDNGFKGTLRHLAKLSDRKIVFIELDQVCRIIATKDSLDKVS